MQLKTQLEMMEQDCQAISETWQVHNEADVYAAISAGRMIGNTMGFEHADQMRLETIIAELARNALRYGGGGTVSLLTAFALAAIDAPGVTVSDVASWRCDKGGLSTHSRGRGP